jgi:hypothetical protein
VDDHTCASRKHRGQQGPIEAHGRHQVEIDLLSPLFVVERREAAGGRLRSAEHVHDHIDTAQCVEREPSNTSAPLRCGDIRRDIVHAIWRLCRNRASGRRDCHPILVQDLDDGGSHSLRAAGHERTTAGDFQVEVHAVISNRAIASLSKVKRYWSIAGLPGKSPLTRAVTTVLWPKVSCETGSDL